MDLGLNNKIALITAASQGLGKASALSIANEGATVIICSRDKEKISKSAKLLFLVFEKMLLPKILEYS